MVERDFPCSPCFSDERVYNQVIMSIYYTREFWDGLDWSQTNKAIAKKVNRSVMTVYGRRLTHAPEIYRRVTRPKIDWANVDWTKDTPTLSLELQKSLPTIYMNRRIFAPHTRGVRKPRERSVRPDVDWGKTDMEISREVGLTRERIRQWRLEAGHKPTHIANRERDTAYFTIKAEEAKAWDWQKPDLHLSIEHNISPMLVKRLRTYLQMPKVSNMTDPNSLRQQSKGWDWSLTNGQLAALHNVHYNTVKNYRDLWNAPQK